MDSTRRKRQILSFLDVVLSLTVISPLVVCFWRGWWELLDEWVYPPAPGKKYVDDPNAQLASGLISFFIGLVSKIIVDFCQHFVGEKVYIIRGGGLGHQIVGNIIRGVLIVTDSLLNVFFWRGIFMLGDVILQPSIYVTVAVFVISVFSIMFLFKTSRALIATPMFVSLDTDEMTFKAPTLMGRTPEEPRKYLADVIATQGVYFLAVLAWKTMWSIQDQIWQIEHIAVKDETVDWTSLAIGYTFAIVAFILQFVVTRLPDPSLVRTSAFNVVVFIAFLASLNVWRGGWSVMDHYFPFIFAIDDHVRNVETSLLLGVFGLLALRTCNTVSGRGIMANRVLFDGKLFNVAVLCANFMNSNVPEEYVPILE